MSSKRATSRLAWPCREMAVVGVVTHWYGYDVAVLDMKDDKITLVGRVEVGPEPRGVAMTADGATAFVAVGVSNEIVRVDCNARKVTGRLAVGREPRGVALSPDESRLLVGNARSQNVSLVDPRALTVVQTIPIDGENVRQVTISPDGKMGYVANMRNRRFPTTKNNIDQGWVLGQRLTRVPLDGSTSYATLALDTQGKASSDAHGVAVSQDQKYIGHQLRRHARSDDFPDRSQTVAVAARRVTRPDRT